MARGFGVALLAVGMLVSGTFNTISYKVADWQSAHGDYTPAQCSWNVSSSSLSPPPPSPLAPAADGPSRECKFVHPLVQVGSMFLGELLVWT